MAVGDLMLVDFDGTLIRRDSTRWMVELLLRKRPWRMLWVLPELRMLFRGADENTLQAAKVRCVGKLLESLAEKNLGTVQGEYRRRSMNALRAELAEHMATERAEGTMILVATASPRFLVAAAIGDRADSSPGNGIRAIQRPIPSHSRTTPMPRPPQARPDPVLAQSPTHPLPHHRSLVRLPLRPTDDVDGREGMLGVKGKNEEYREQGRKETTNDR